MSEITRNFVLAQQSGPHLSGLWLLQKLRDSTVTRVIWDEA